MLLHTCKGNIMMQRALPWLMACLLASFQTAVAASDTLTVYTVNYPLQYFAERIGDGHVDVVFPAPAGVDPAFWQPDSDVLHQYQKAGLVLLNGSGYASWVGKVSLPRRKQVNTSAAFAEDYIKVANAPAHTWLDFYQAAQQAEVIKKALSKQLPEYAADFENNYQALHKDLMQLDLTMQRAVASKPGQRFFASHPVYHYLARRYELRIKDMLWEPDSLPEDSQWEQLRYVHEAFLAGWMLWEQAPLSGIGQQLQGIGIGVLVFDPCGNRPTKGDFLSVMQKNIDTLKQAY